MNRGTDESPHFAVIALRCSMCYLKLATRDELAAAGMDVERADDRVAQKATRFLAGAGLSEMPLQMMVEQFLNADVDELD
ncbi:hypothetical protein [Streptomyces mirabilis]|uniref:hypothetical protein n=1 Tax=Streptomyces mirabilis TaxID=68239 RepID=UPI0036E75A3A